MSEPTKGIDSLCPHFANGHGYEESPDSANIIISFKINANG